MSNQPNMPQGGYSSGNNGYGNNNSQPGGGFNNQSSGYGNGQSGHGGQPPYGSNQSGGSYGSQPGSGYGGSQPGSNYGGSQPGSGYGGSQPGSNYGGSQPGSGYGGSQQGSGYGNNQSSHGSNQPGGGYGGSQPQGNYANLPQGGGNLNNAPSGGYSTPMSQYQKEEDTKKNWKIGGGIAAGVLAAGAAAFGAKYLIDQHQEHEQQQQQHQQSQFHDSKPNNYGSNNNAPLNPGEPKPSNQNYQQHNQYPQDHKSESHCQQPPQYQQPPQQQQQHHQHHDNKSSYDSHRPSGAQGVTPHAYPLIDHHSGEDHIKIGSKIALKHNMTGRFLAHSYNAPTNDNGGSGQPLLYCSGWNVSSAEYWQVIPANGEVLVPGHPLNYGTYIRLRHVETKRQAHSHNGLRALRSSQQEATGYGGETCTDNNDHWIVEKYGGGHGAWSANDTVTFRHAETGRYLHSHPEMIDNDRQEVTCGGDGRDENDKWRVCFH